MKSQKRCINMVLLSILVMALSLITTFSTAYAVAVPTGNVVIRIVNSEGNPIQNAAIRYQTSSWYEAGNTDSNGEVSVSVPEKFSTIRARAYYNGAYAEIRQDIRQNSVIEFKTVKTAVSLKNSIGEPLEGGVVRFSFNSWVDYGVTDSTGQAFMELLPVQYTFRMLYSEGQVDIKQNIGTNPEVAFRTIKVNVSLKDSEGNGLVGGTATYMRSLRKDFGVTGSDGNAVKELLTGTYTFRMSYSEGQVDIKQNIGLNPEVAFRTIKVNVSFKDSEGNGIAGGTATYLRSSWKDFEVTGTDGNAVKELLTGTYTFRMSYEEGRMDIKQDIGLNPEVAFRTAKVTVRLQDISGNGLEGGKVRYLRSLWRDFGTTGTDGNAVKQLLNSTYTFRMYEGSKYQDKKTEIAGDTLVSFTSIITTPPVKTWTLTTSISPSNGGSVVITPLKAIYNDGDKVSFSVTPAQNYIFTGYSGQNGAEVVNNTLTMNANKAVSIMFEEDATTEEYHINYSVEPQNSGTVTITPSKATYLYGETVQISANAADGFEFVQITGTGLGAGSLPTLPYSFAITGDVNFTALFKEIGAVQTITVHNITELNQAEITARNGNVIILLDDGVYELSDQFVVSAEHVTVKSLNNNASKVTVKGKGMNGNVPHVFEVYSKYFTVEAITLGWVKNHGIQIHGERDADYPVIRNVDFRDTYEQMLKVSYSSSQSDFCDNGIVEGCSFVYTAGIGPQWYIGGVDAHKSKGWIVRNNLFQDIISPTSSLSEGAVHFWSDSTDTLVEKNLIIDCDRGVMFGLDNSHHYNGIIRNNFIHATKDVGIYLANTHNAKIYNNTVFVDSSYSNAIEYRFAGTNVNISNNLTNKVIRSRDGGVATLASNVDFALETWFTDAHNGNLHLKESIYSVVDQGIDIEGLTHDIDGDIRQAGKVDIGADEASFNANPVNSGNEKIIFLHHSTGGGVYSGGGVPAWFTAYNSQHNTTYKISERGYPNSPYPWNNYPYDFWYLWVTQDESGNPRTSGCNSASPGIECLQTLTTNYNVVIFKHCYPGSDIQADTGTPSISSSRKSLENYKLQYRALRREMDKYPDNKFIVWTLAPRHRLATTPANAARAAEFVRWVKNDFLTEDGKAHPNIYIFDFWGNVAEERENPPAGQVNTLRYDYENSHTGNDSHPNQLANQTVGPVFAQFIVDAINNTVTPPVKTWTLTTAISPSNGGSVTVTPSKANYNDGESVNVTVTPAQNYSFSSYGGENGVEVVNNTLTMNGNKSISINFVANNSNGNDNSIYYPAWKDAVPLETVTLNYDSAKTSVENGAILKSKIAALTPGQKLEIAQGTWSVNSWFSIDLRGTAQNPIWICAKAGEKVVLTRPDANQNAVNIGANGGARYLVLQNIEITGGDTLLKLYDCANVWIHKCHIHHGNGVGIAANSANTDHLYLTENEIHDTGGSAEGMYLGANNSAQIMTNSVIAKNHIYNCYGTQGDGIEVKQGSYNNWIVENHVHDTNYPCILVYGTNGNGLNIIERNVIYRSNDNTMQVQGEAVVRNNLIISGAASGFASTDHQGQTLNLTVVHNTIINTARAANFSSWNNRTGMILANNAIYSKNAESIRFPNGSAGVTVSGNVVYENVSGTQSGFIYGTGLNDFASISWDGANRDGKPSLGSPLIGIGDSRYSVEADITGKTRETELEAGAFDY